MDAKSESLDMGSRLDPVRFEIRSGTYTTWLASTLVTTGFVACQAFGGHPAGDGPPVVPDSGQPCLGTCLPDPGWAAVSADECNAASKLDKLPIIGFDDVGSTGNVIAIDMYSYTDGTVKPLLFEFTKTIAGGVALSADGFQPPTRRVDFCGPGAANPVNPMLATPGDYALHLMGGFIPAGDHAGACGNSCEIVPAPFRGYGGGLGVSMQKLNNRDTSNGDGNNRQFCNSTKPGAGPGTRPDVCPPLDAEYAVRIGALDVSAYDGVSFWARRGPNSQIGIHVLVGDKYTDDDLSYLSYRNDPAAPRHCERIRQCSCSNHRDCQFGAGLCEYPGCNGSPLANAHPACPLYSTSAPGASPGGPGYYCLPFDQLSVGTVSLNGQGGSYCSPLGVAITDPNILTGCNAPYAAYPNDGPDGAYIGTPCGVANSAGIPASAGLAGDRQFWGKPCTPYAYANGSAAAYCFDPATDPPPADPTQQCGDHWLATVDLSTDWQFYKVPFTDLRQQGFAKKSEQLDLHSVSVLRFTWDTGWIDYWIDDVSFYRNPRSSL